MSEWSELTWDDAMQRGYEALSQGEALYEEIDAEEGRSNIDIEKHLRRAELTDLTRLSLRSSMGRVPMDGCSAGLCGQAARAGDGSGRGSGSGIGGCGRDEGAPGQLAGVRSPEPGWLVGPLSQ
jgi:hypothetical protein